MATPVNLTESQQKALEEYRIALEQRGYCCNTICSCPARRARGTAENVGVPKEELSQALQKSREASRQQQSKILSAEPQVQIAENPEPQPEKPADPKN